MPSQGQRGYTRPWRRLVPAQSGKMLGVSCLASDALPMKFLSWEYSVMPSMESWTTHTLRCSSSWSLFALVAPPRPSWRHSQPEVRGPIGSRIAGIRHLESALKLETLPGTTTEESRFETCWVYSAFSTVMYGVFGLLHVHICALASGRKARGI